MYFERHDGSAATVDDFFDAMSDANGGVDISRLKNWYSQAGTPTVRCEPSYDEAARTFSLTLEQILPVTPDDGGDAPKAPQLIPIAVGLLSPTSGSDLALDPSRVTVVDEIGGVGKSAAVRRPRATPEPSCCASTPKKRRSCSRTCPNPGTVRASRIQRPGQARDVSPGVPRPSPLRARQRFGHVQQVGSGANVGARRRRSRDARARGRRRPRRRGVRGVRRVRRRRARADHVRPRVVAVRGGV